jgi:hypothetical protein
LQPEDPRPPQAPRRGPRLRWLTLAEIVGILALMVAALGWWDNHRERAQEAADRAAASRTYAADVRRAALRETFLLTGQVVDEGRIRLSAARPDQVIQTQTVVFPSMVRRTPVETTGNPRIDLAWFEDGLKDTARGRGAGGVEARLPVGVVTTYVEAGETRTDRSIYAIGYTLHHRTLRGSKVELDGLSLVRRGVSGDLQPTLDKAWG